MDGDGNITYEEFMKGLRDPLSQRRIGIIQKVFAMLDKDRSA